MARPPNVIKESFFSKVLSLGGCASAGVVPAEITDSMELFSYQDVLRRT